MKAGLARAAYNLLLRAGTPLYFARLRWRGRHEPAYRRHWAERLGLGAPAVSGAAAPLWIHAVSLGETRAAAALIDALRQREPGLRLLLTHGTATGREAGAALLRAGDRQCWLPYDTPGSTRRFLQRQRPALGVLMETEIWPNLLHAAAAAGVPMVLANARLSGRSARLGERSAALLYPAVATLARVLAQTDDDAQRLRTAGAADVRVLGNIKFDMTPDAALLARGQRWGAALDRPVVLAASTREGEEEPLLRAWSALPSPRPLLVIVPRHPQRFDAVADLIAAKALKLVRRSHWAVEPTLSAANADVWLGDSLGEMAQYYGLADVALLGGSFAALGGQNLIEAAACGCPLVMGPHTFNFAEAAELALAAGAAERAADIDDAVARALALLRDPQRTAAMRRAAGFASAHRGAAGRMADELLALLRAAN